MYLLIIVGSLAVGIFAFVVCLEVYKGGRKKYTPVILVPGSNQYSPREISKLMVRDVRMGHYLMHTLANEAPPFDDEKYLEKYRSDIQDPAVINYIQSVKGELENE